MSFEVNGVGRFCKDPVVREAGNTKVCDFTLASNEVVKGGAEKKEFTTFLDCVVWDGAAETIAKYCKKGDRLFVRGTLRQDKWVDKESGQNREKKVLRVTNFEFLSSRNENAPASQSGGGGSGKSQNDGDDVPF